MPHPVKRIILTNHAGGMAFKVPSIEISGTMTVAQALEAAGLDAKLLVCPAAPGGKFDPAALISPLVSDGQVVYVEM